MTAATLERTWHRPIDLACTAHRNLSRWPITGNHRELIRQCPGCAAARDGLLDENGDCFVRGGRDWALGQLVSQICFHEAGHAVVGLITGHDLKTLAILAPGEIRSDEIRDDADFAGRVIWGPSDVDAVDFMTMCWAGQVAAECRLAELGLTSASDRFDAVLGAADDARQAYEAADEYGLDRGAGFWAAKALVRREWAAISRLAEVAQVRGSLDGEQVRNIVGL